MQNRIFEETVYPQPGHLMTSDVAAADAPPTTPPPGLGLAAVGAFFACFFMWSRSSGIEAWKKMLIPLGLAGALLPPTCFFAVKPAENGMAPLPLLAGDADCDLAVSAARKLDVDEPVLAFGAAGCGVALLDAGVAGCAAG